MKLLKYAAFDCRRSVLKSIISSIVEVPIPDPGILDFNRRRLMKGRRPRRVASKLRRGYFLGISTSFQQFSVISNNITIQPRRTEIIMDFLDKFPKPFLAAFAGLGFYLAASYVLSYARLLLSLFVLSGKNVCITHQLLSDPSADVSISYVVTVPKAHGQSSPVLPTVSAKNMQSSWHRRVSI